MAYRKTTNVKAQLKERRENILDAAEFVLAKYGREGFFSPRVVERAGLSIGTLYTYFADVDELWAAVVAHALARDVAAIRAVEHPWPLNAYSRAIAVFYGSLEKSRLARALNGSPAYRKGIRAEFETLLAALAFPPRLRAIDAAAVVAGLYGLADVGASTRAAQTFALRAVGIPEEAARAIA